MRARILLVSAAIAAALVVGVVYLGGSSGRLAAAGGVKPATKKAPMTPTFYDTKTYEPLPASKVAPVPMRAPARAAAAPAALVAPMTMPVPAPFQLAKSGPLDPPGTVERLVPAQDRVLAIAPDTVRVLGPDLATRTQFFTPAGALVDPEHDLAYMADPLGFLIARRLKDRSIAWRILPTIPRGYERHPLFCDGSKILFASVELPQMTPGAPHVPDITMFEWWSLGNTSEVDPANLAPAGAAARAATFSRTRPLAYAAGAAGDPLVLAQSGHVMWLDASLALTADVAVPADASVLALDVDGQGRARLVVRTAEADRFWWIDRSGAALADAALPDRSAAGAKPAIVPGAGGVVNVISGRSISHFDRDGAMKWQLQMPEAPVSASPEGAELVAVSGTRLFRVHADGHADLLYEAREPLTAAPLVRSGSLVLATAHAVLAVQPAR